jgi:hypothetical protein
VKVCGCRQNGAGKAGTFLTAASEITFTRMYDILKAKNTSAMHCVTGLTICNVSFGRAAVKSHRLL